jgi:thioester reductase-like protein
MANRKGEPSPDMRLLVTGGAGFLGSFVIEELWRALDFTTSPLRVPASTICASRRR